MAERELEIKAPRPLFYALPKAIEAFIQSGCDRTKMNVQAWARTFHAEHEAIRSEWDRQMSVKSQSPDNSFETPEGK